MKIKVFILTIDLEYAENFAYAVSEMHSEKLSVSFSSSKEVLKDEMDFFRPDVILIDDVFSEEHLESNVHCGVAYLVENSNIDTVNGEKTISKYQSISKSCNDLFEVYAEKQANIGVSLKGNINKNQHIITFMSPAGGVGTSSLAAAFAEKLAHINEKVLYLNLQQFDSSDNYFSGEGEYGFSRVIYALEMANNATTAKLESALKKDSHGVYFYSGCGSALDLLALNEMKMVQLFEELSAMAMFDWIVVDMDCSLTNLVYQQLERSYLSIFVTDGQVSSNKKIERLFDALEIVSNQQEELPFNRMFLMYNRYSNKHSKKSNVSIIKEIGGVNKFENATTKELINLIANTNAFDNILAFIGR